MVILGLSVRLVSQGLPDHGFPFLRETKACRTLQYFPFDTQPSRPLRHAPSYGCLCTQRVPCSPGEDKEGSQSNRQTPSDSDTEDCLSGSPSEHLPSLPSHPNVPACIPVVSPPGLVFVHADHPGAPGQGSLVVEIPLLQVHY